MSVIISFSAPAFHTKAATKSFPYPTVKKEHLLLQNLRGLKDESKFSIDCLSGSRWRGEQLFKLHVLVRETAFWDEPFAMNADTLAEDMITNKSELYEALLLPLQCILEPEHIRKQSIRAAGAAAFYSHLLDIVGPNDVPNASALPISSTVRVRILRQISRFNYSEDAMAADLVNALNENISALSIGDSSDGGDAQTSSGGFPESIGESSGGGDARSISGGFPQSISNAFRARGPRSLQMAVEQVDNAFAAIDKSKSGHLTDYWDTLKISLPSSEYTPSVKLESKYNEQRDTDSQDELLTTVAGHWFVRMILQAYNTTLSARNELGKYPKYLEATMSQTRYIVTTTLGTYEARTDGAVEIQTYDGVTSQATDDEILVNCECKRHSKTTFLPQHFAQLLACMASRLQALKKRNKTSYEDTTDDERTVYLLCFNRLHFRVVWATFTVKWLEWIFGPWNEEIDPTASVHVPRVARDTFQDAKISPKYSLADVSERMEAAKIITYVTCLHKGITGFSYERPEYI